MRKFSKVTAAAAFAVVAAFAMQPAHAWWGPGWGGPGGGGNDWMGDGFGDFNMNMSGRSNAWGRGHYDRYYGHPYGGYYGAPYGYGAPHGYGAPRGYGVPPGYGAPYGAPPRPPAPVAPR